MWWLLPIAVLLGLLVLQTFVIWMIYKRPEAPQQVTILEIKEVIINNYIYKLGLPGLGATDVARRELHVIQDGVETVFEITDVNLTEYEVTLVEDQHVSVFLVDIDDAGNRSANGKVLEFDVTDLVAPDAPDAPTIIDVTVQG